MLEVPKPAMIAIAAALVAAMLGVLLTAEFYDVSKDAADDSRLTYTDNTTNRNFTENILDNQIFGWDNFVDSVADGGTAAASWDTSGYALASRTDNGEGVASEDNVENVIFHESVTINAGYDNISAATLQYKYRIIDNTGILPAHLTAGIQLYVLLDDGSENEVVFENLTASKGTAWIAQENNLLDNIDVGGTYTVWLRAEINPDNSGATTRVLVGWDDVVLSVNGYNKDYPEEALEETGNKLGTLWTFAIILLMIFVAALMLKQLGMI